MRSLMPSGDVRWAVLGLLVCLISTAARAEEGTAQVPPTGEAPSSVHSRLTVAGSYTVEAYLQKNFFLGAEAVDSTATGFFGDFNTFWTQQLNLRPRFILSDNLNVNLDLDLAHGIWGVDNQPPSGQDTGYTDLYNGKSTLLDVQLNRAYLAFRHPGTKTRWYLGRQEFGLGHLIVLDQDAPGLQVHRDLPRLGATVCLGLAKTSENANGLTDRNGYAHAANRPNTGPDGRDADLYMLDWRMRNKKGDRLVNPFFVYYLDRSNADGTTYLPTGQGYLDARFRPNVTRCTVAGFSGKWGFGPVQVEAEYDKLKGVDRIRNASTGPDMLLDVNDGDIKGSNIYLTADMVRSRLEFTGTVAMGSGDDFVWSGPGNINSLRNQGHFSLTEVWGNGLALDELGLAPQGLGNPFTRGYRGLENTRIFQGAASYQLRKSVRLGGSYSMIRAAKALRPWYDRNGDGILTRDEYGRDVRSKNQLGSSTELGSEIDARIDWDIEQVITVSLRGGIFTPGIGAGYLINGTEKYQETVTHYRLGVSVPIPEFSLGG
jgi:hypothetical protein